MVAAVVPAVVAVPAVVVLAVQALATVAGAAAPRARLALLRMRLPAVPLFLAVAAAFPVDLVVAFPVAAAQALPRWLGPWTK